MDDDPRDLVRRGYDAVSATYRRDDFALEGTGYEKVLGWLGAHAGPGRKALDVGCGCGVPVARALAQRGCDVVGVDLSEVQIARARRNVPGADLRLGDIMDFDPGSTRFDLVVAFYSVFHLPLADQRTLLERFGRWTTPGGLFLGTLNDEHASGYVEEDWLGVDGATMFWSHTHLATYRDWLEGAGFRLLREDVLVDSGGHRHPVLLAERRK